MKHQVLKNSLESLDYEIAQLKLQLEAHKGRGNSLLVPRPQVRKPIRKLSLMKRSFFGSSNEYGLRFIRNSICMPLGIIDLKDSREEVSKNKDKVAIKLSEDDGKPQIAEMNEEEERKIDEESRKKRLGVGTDIEMLGHGLRDAQIDLDWHRTLTDLLMDELVKTREQANAFKRQIAEIKLSSEQVIQDESRNWKLVTDSLKVYKNLSYRKTMIKNLPESKRQCHQCMNY